MEQNKDMINPSHYKQYPIEVIEMMVSVFGEKRVADYCLITAFKYRMRLGHKDEIKQELGKEEWYLNKYSQLSKNEGVFKVPLIEYSEVAFTALIIWENCQEEIKEKYSSEGEIYRMDKISELALSFCIETTEVLWGENTNTHTILTSNGVLEIKSNSFEEAVILFAQFELELTPTHTALVEEISVNLPKDSMEIKKSQAVNFFKSGEVHIHYIIPNGEHLSIKVIEDWGDLQRMLLLNNIHKIYITCKS